MTGVGDDARVATTVRSSRRSLAGVIAGTILGVAVVGGAIGVGIAKFAGKESRGDSASPAASAVATGAPAPSADVLTRLVSVDISAPPLAEVYVDGARVSVQDNKVEIRGAIGSVHAVRVAANGLESKAEIVIAENGPVPSKVELASPPPALGDHKPVRPTSAAPKSSAGASHPTPVKSTPPAGPAPAGAPTIKRDFF
jgi:hypothetical protein